MNPSYGVQLATGAYDARLFFLPMFASSAETGLLFLPLVFLHIFYFTLLEAVKVAPFQAHLHTAKICTGITADDMIWQSPNYYRLLHHLYALAC